MKQCPTCKKEFADSMRFCQTDGTPLVEMAANVPPPDPYKTVVGGMIKMDEDLLQLPEQDDPNKTMVSSAEPPRSSPPKVDAPPPKPPAEPTLNIPSKAESKPPEPSAPKFSEPSLSPPSFGDLSSSPASNVSSGSSPFNDPPKTDSSPFGNPPPPSFGASPFSNEPSKSDSPFGKQPSPPNSSPFDKPASQSASSPFDKTPPPPYKDPEPMFGGPPPAFNQSPFSQPQTPFGQSNEPSNQPFQQNEWAPPPAPVAGWQDQGLGANTPFQPPVAEGQNNTLAIVSLVCGILSICLCGIFTGIPALITGYMAKNNADSNPAEYGGRGMALAGLITGGIGTVLGILGIIYYIIVIASAASGNF